MKKLILTWSIILISLLGFSQVTSVGEFRIANATTAFDVNLPIGTKVYNIATGDYWVATAGVASTANLTTASASFAKLNPAETAQNLSFDAANHEIDISGSGTSAVIPLSVDDGTTEGLASFTANDFTVTAGNVAIDYTNGQAASNSQPGFATAAQISAIESNTAKATNVSTALSTGTVNTTSYGITSDGGANDIVLVEATTSTAGILGADKWDEIVANTNKVGISSGQANAITANTAKETNVSTALSTGTVNATSYGITSDGGANDLVLVEATTSTAGLLGADKWDEIVANTNKVGISSGQANAITENTEKETNVTTDLSLGTVTTTTMDVNSSDGTNATLTAATSSAAGVMTATQVAKLEGIAAGAQVNLTLITEKFEEDDGTATAHSLSQTAVTAQGCRVSINGATLAPADYTLTTSTIKVGVPVYKYDQIVITYSY